MGAHRFFSRLAVFAGVALLSNLHAASARAGETLSLIEAKALGQRVSLAVGADLGYHRRAPSLGDRRSDWDLVGVYTPPSARAGFGVALGIGSKKGGARTGIFAVDYASTLGMDLHQEAIDGSVITRPARYQDATLRLGLGMVRAGSKVGLVAALTGGLRLSSYFSPVTTAYVNHLRVGPAAVLTLGISGPKRRIFAEARPQVAYLMPGSNLKTSANASARIEGGARLDLGVRIWRGYYLGLFGEHWGTTNQGSPSQTFGISLNHLAGR
jgi:hypothetical protein